MEVKACSYGYCDTFARNGNKYCSDLHERKAFISFWRNFIIVALAICFFIFVRIVNASNFDTGMQHYYNMSNTLVDNLGDTNLANLGGSPDGLASCKITNLGGCYHYDGSTDSHQMSSVTHNMQGAFTPWYFSVWINVTAPSGTDTIFYEATANYYWKVKIDSTNVIFQYADGTGSYQDATFSKPTDGWHHFIFAVNSTHHVIWMDGIKGTHKIRTGTYNSGTTIISIMSDHTPANFYGGHLTDLGFWKIYPTYEDVSLLYNSGNGCNVFNNPTGCGDAVKPKITNITQVPYNTTVLNLATNNLNVSAIITDASNIITKNLSLRLNHTEVYINGTLYNYNGTFAPTYNISNKNYWILSEGYFLGGSFPFASVWTYNQPHYNFTFQGSNKYLKYKFFNISNKIQSNFYEDMADNLTGVESFSDYFYCNSSYTTGSPLVNSNCVLFASVSNKANYHSHNKSFHRVIPLGINTTTGKIGNVYVTPTSYILKRGTVAGEKVYYINAISRSDFAQISSNAGSSYSNLLYSPDVHVHQISPLAQILYKICVEDEFNNANCTVWRSTLVTFPSIPPNAVTFYEPLEDGSYLGKIFINHTESISPSGFNISSYQYSYAVYGSSSYTDITTLTPITHNTYYWNVNDFTDNYYTLKLVITDSEGLTTTQYLQHFYITQNVTPTPPLINTSGLEDATNNIASSFNFFTLMIFFIFGLIIFGWQELLPSEKRNYTIIVILVFMFVGFQVKFITLGESTYAWLSFLVWVLGMINLYNSEN